MRVYLDTNVFIAYIREEMDRSFNLRYIESEEFFIFCRTKKIVVIISQLFMKEVNRVISLPENELKITLNELGLIVEYTPNAPKDKAYFISRETGIHFADAWHAANAITENCEYIVTFNLSDFKKTDNLIQSISPTDFTRLN